VGFVVDKVALGRVFSEYFGFPCQFSFHLLVHTHHLTSGAGTIGQIVADVPSGLSLTQHQEIKKKIMFEFPIGLKRPEVGWWIGINWLRWIETSTP
jgi:hypothetical protein